MGDLLQRGGAWLERWRARHLSHAVTYVRGGHSVEVWATVGRTEFDQTDEYGIVHRLESRDYLLQAAALILVGETVTPREGDRIRETTGGKVWTYEVMAPGGEPPWRYSDADRLTLRIHTKHVGTEDV